MLFNIRVYVSNGFNSFGFNVSIAEVETFDWKIYWFVTVLFFIRLR